MVHLLRARMGIFSELWLVILVLGVTVHARSLDSQLITLEEAKYYMDATATSESHEFDVVSPLEVESSRQKRGADNPFGMSQYKFRAFGEDFHLQLTTNRQLTAKGLAVQYVDADGNVEERPLPAEHETCYKFGRVLSHEGASRVAVSTCNNGLSGLVKLESFELFIQKLTDNHTESVRRRRRDIENPHIVYRRTVEADESDDEEEESNPHFCGLEEFYHFPEPLMERHMPMDGDADSSSRRRKREATCANGTPLGTKILELLVVIDAEMTAYHSSHGRSATDYTLTLMNTVASSYLHDSLGVPLTIKIVQLRVLQSADFFYGGPTALTITPDGGLTLRSFCLYQSFLNTFDDSDPNHFDNAVLLTRHNLELQGNSNLLGIAQFNGACNKDFSCSLVEESGFGSGVVLTHELGHNLGMEHDGETRFSSVAANCQDGVNIMSSSRTNGQGSFIWSSCSSQQLNTFLCHPWSTCLDDNISGSETRTLNPSDMPGTRFTGDEQCLLIDADTHGTCTRHTDICGHLACMYSSGRCIGTGVAALDGTTCGTNMWCVEGACVNKAGNPAPPTPQPVNGGWSDWTAQPCSVTCGQGTQARTRQCNNPVPQNGGQFCAGSSTDTVTCYSQACPVNVPINGGWSSWQYSTCSVTCGDGTLQGTRTCTNPRPQNGGADCSGPAVITYTCRQLACPNVVHGGWSDWRHGPCSQSCGGGQQALTRTCNNPIPQNGGTPCIGNTYEIVSCNTQACPVVVHGEWSPWAYGPCSQTCGRGTLTRTRTCTNPAPQNNGQYCSGSSTETVACSNQQECPVNGGWSAWQPFSPCSVTCGSGQRTRSRSCTNPPPQNNGQTCAGSNIEYQSCSSSQACPVDGGWSAWQPFSPCSVTCGTGQRSRIRSCTNPPPQNGGQPCAGSNAEFQTCSSGQVCVTPVNGGWSPWQPFGACSATCGGGQEYRSRTCTNPAPQNGGLTCSGSGTEGRGCNTQDCSPTTSSEEETGVFQGGQFQAYTVFLNIPVGATSVLISNTVSHTHMAIKDGDAFVLGEVSGNFLPPPTVTRLSYRGTSIVHDLTRSGPETVVIDGPTTVALQAAVHVILNPALFGQRAFPDITWSYRQPSTAAGTAQWVRTEGPCSQTCGAGFYTEVIRCATISNQQHVFHDDERPCSHLAKPTPNAQSCNKAVCPSVWRFDEPNCSGLCGEASGTRNIYCISDSTYTAVPDNQCDAQTRPSDTAPCHGLPPCLQECDGIVVTSQGSVNRMITPTGGKTCSYTIVAPVGMVISLQLVNYNIDCAGGEELVFKDGFQSTDHCTRYVFPGTITEYTTNVMQIEHKTTQAGHGYHVVYSFVYKTQSSDCDKILLQDSGTLQSPNYPNDYPEDQTCHNIIVAPANMKIVLTFNELSLYNLCSRSLWRSYDYITIKDYDQAVYPWYCGTFSNPSQLHYESVSNRLLVTFKSNSQFSSRGFHASYTFVRRS